MNIALRPIVPDDQPFLYRVYAGTRREELAQVPWTDAQKETFLRMQLAAQACYYQEHYAGVRCKRFGTLEGSGR